MKTTRRAPAAKNDSGFALLDLVIGVAIFGLIASIAALNMQTLRRRALEASGDAADARPWWGLDVLHSTATLFGTAAASIIVILLLTTAVAATRGHVRGRREAGLSQDMLTKGFVPA